MYISIMVYVNQNEPMIPDTDPDSSLNCISGHTALISMIV